jgi:hypothetical protein
MRDFGKRKTHASNGQELAEMFVAEDGRLSIYHKDEECEVVGFESTVHADFTKVVVK